MICAPSTSNSLPPKLRTRTESGCQRLLTVGNRACGGALERLERRVRLESLGEVLGTFCTEVVAEKTASEGAFRVSAAADSRNGGMWRRT